MSQGSRRVAPTPHPAGGTTIYDGNRAYGDAIQFNGDINGDVYFPEWPREQCLRDLRVTDPREDRARIEGDKDRLLRDCYAWILYDSNFQQWRAQDASRVLWIKGDPGKGKTMMTMGLIAELSREDSTKPWPRIMTKMPAKMKFKSKQDPHDRQDLGCQQWRVPADARGT